MTRPIVLGLLALTGLYAELCVADEYEDLPQIYGKMADYAAQAGVDGSYFFLNRGQASI